MLDTAPVKDLERRKHLRILLRKDIRIEAHKYEGRTYYILKDPVSLRYYRLKENEHYLLQFLDGEHTLESAQKSYEERYRPERLRLEDLEAFAQQLLTAGLAQNDSARAGQQLFERRKKRRNRELMQTLTNILYIKIPVVDPDKWLQGMLGWCGFIFSTWFFIISLIFMFSAVTLVATHFDTFLSKLPNYQEFFSVKTIVNLWVALAIVKIIHEFGHGLSCKKFGGEVHEMGLLFLCFSPAMYCNVSDAWTLPSKWHRIIISAAGIYVELVIAAISTFVWWNTPTQPYVNNMALSLMIVCSVSTVVFNANPLMRYDGYYVLADWLEIPNLRERSNRYLSNLCLEICMGVEVQPEGYMELGRKILFVTYAIVSYIYRWVITFAILWFTYSFLRPYKLEVISNFLTIASIASMGGWPIYNLGKNIWRRGRLPDMKRWRVVVSGCVLAALLLFVFLVPVPINRVRVVGVVQAQEGYVKPVTITEPGRLEYLKVSDGQYVRKGELLAELSNSELTVQMMAAKVEAENDGKYVSAIEKQLRQNPDESDKLTIKSSIADYKAKQSQANLKAEQMAERSSRLLIRASRDGVVSNCPRLEDVGKYFENDPKHPFCMITDPVRLRVTVPVVPSELHRLRENLQAAAAAGHAELPVTLRVHGRDSRTWSGRVTQMPESEAATVPWALSNKGGGPVAVKAGSAPDHLAPTTQFYLVDVEILDPDDAIAPGNMAQVKIICQPETCAQWLYRTVHGLFDLGLM